MTTHTLRHRLSGFTSRNALLRRVTCLLPPALVLAGGSAIVLLPGSAQAAVDHKPPTVTVTRPAPEATGWYRSPLHVQFSAFDAAGLENRSTVTESGAQSGSFTMDDNSSFADVTVSTDGSTTFTYDIYDVNDNHTTGTFTVKLDATAPAVDVRVPQEGQSFVQGAAVRPEAVFYGDATSGRATWGITAGVDEDGYLDTSTPGPKTFRASSDDIAGNTTTVVRHFTVTAHHVPTMTFTPDLTANPAGWYRSAPVVRMHVDTFDGAGPKWFTYLLDQDQGLSDTVNWKPDGYVLITKQGSTLVQAQPVDTADSIGALDGITIKVDTVAPTATLEQHYPFLGVGNVYTPEAACEDATSGIASCVVGGDVRSDGTLDTGTAGANTVTLVATDRAGNSTTTSRVYNVAPTQTSGGTGDSGSGGPGAGGGAGGTDIPGTSPGTGSGSTSGSNGETAFHVKQPVVSTVRANLTKNSRTVIFEITTPAGAVADGTVTVTDGTKVIGTVAVHDGRAKLKLIRLRHGRHLLSISYGGAEAILPSVTHLKVRVR